jgi:hypothetical protein
MSKLSTLDKSIFWFNSRKFAMSFGFGSDCISVITRAKEGINIYARHVSTHKIILYPDSFELFASENGKLVSQKEEIIQFVISTLKGSQYNYDSVELQNGKPDL